MKLFTSIADVKAANNARGFYFFSRESMRFFASRIETGFYGGRYFITSEKNFDGSKRLYTVRRAEDNGNIKTVGEFQGHRSIEDARDAAKAAAKNEEVSV